MNKCCFSISKGIDGCGILNKKDCNNCFAKCTSVAELKKRYESIIDYGNNTNNSHDARNEYQKYKKNLAG